jgi:Protein of unknown function (DUF3019)
MNRVSTMHRLAALVACVSFVASADAATQGQGDVQLELQPRICTLAADDPHCDTTVRAQWKSPRDESLCLVIVGHPDIKRCWENFSQGLYQVELTFDEDLVVELRDPQLQRVLASEAITVIREALRLRRKRRQPWNILY